MLAESPLNLHVGQERHKAVHGQSHKHAPGRTPIQTGYFAASRLAIRPGTHPCGWPVSYTHLGPQLRVGEALLGGCLSDFATAASFIVDYGFAAAPDELRHKTRQAILDAGAMTTFGDFLALSLIHI